jgi:hypothetical protein
MSLFKQSKVQPRGQAANELAYITCHILGGMREVALPKSLSSQSSPWRRPYGLHVDVLLVLQREWKHWKLVSLLRFCSKGKVTPLV